MNNFFLILLLALTLTNNLYGLELERNSNNQLILTANKCSTLKDELDAFSELYNWSNQNVCALPDVVNKGNGSCSANITNCLPEHIINHHGKKSKIEGPNCYNLALVMNNFISANRYSGYNEIDYFINDSGYCRNIDPEEERKAGDIGVIGKRIQHKSSPPRFVIEHTYINISKNLVYSKNGKDKNSSYEVQSKENVLDLYKLKDKSCHTNVFDSSCQYTSSYFRCTPYVGAYNNESEVSRKLLKFNELVDKLESELESQIYNLKLIYNKRSALTFKETAMQVNEFSEKELKGVKVDQLAGSDAYLAQTLIVRLDSIYDQVGYLHPTYSSYGNIPFAGTEWKQKRIEVSELQRIVFFSKKYLEEN